MSFIEKITAQPKLALATVAISCLTLGFAGGMSVGKQKGATKTPSQALTEQPSTGQQAANDTSRPQVKEEGQNQQANGQQMQPPSGRPSGRKTKDSDAPSDRMPPDVESGASEQEQGFRDQKSEQNKTSQE